LELDGWEAYWYAGSKWPKCVAVLKFRHAGFLLYKRYGVREDPTYAA